MPPSDAATQNTPLAPSVEKAYYRKCIALKRRLNEVEAANEDLKIRRVRLDRAIMKMRLERAFLLDELRKRMDRNVDVSDGSGDEGLATPPPDRPHRDKRRKQPSSQPTAHSAAAIPGLIPANPYSSAEAAPIAPENNTESVPPLVPGPDGQMVPANAIHADGRPFYLEPTAPRPSGSSPYPGPQHLQHGSPNNHLGNILPEFLNEKGQRSTDEHVEQAIGDERGANGET